MKDNTNISTDLFYKKTDSHQYLLFNSCHPAHTKRNIPFNMARRICTIVSDEERRNKRLEELKTFLCRQKYPNGLVAEAIRNAKQEPISELRKFNREKTPGNSSTKIPFVVTYNPRNHNIFNTTRHCLPVLHHSKILKDIIKEKKISTAEHSPLTLKNFL